MRLLHVLPLAVALLAGCAAGPQFDTVGTDPALTPAAVVPDMEAKRGTAVIWGGVIVATTNLRNGTRLELLGYPLNRSQRPDIAAPAQGRFLVYWPEYLESVDFAAGRQLSVRGRLDGLESGQVGQSRYLYPVVAAERLWLWPRPGERSTDPTFHFGFGVFLHN